MPNKHLSLAGLMGAIALLGVEFAALRAASYFWFSAIYTLTVVLLLLAVLAARYRRASAGAFWFGFAVFGWAYFLLALGPWSASRSRSDELGFERFNPDLLTTRLLRSSLHLIRGSANDYGSIEQFDEYTIGLAHLMWTLVLGIAGGWTAIVLRLGRHRASTPRPASSTALKTTLFALGGITVLSILGARTLYQRSEPVYFPGQIFDKDQERNQFMVDWYSPHLVAMGEASLSKAAEGDEGTTTYRLLWLPSFHHPACVRVSRNPRGAATLRVVVLDGQGGYQPGQIAIDKTIRLTESDWKEIEQQFDRLRFWSLPTKIDGDGGCDGEQLVLEGTTPGRYHVLDRWSPDGDYFKVCAHLLKLSNVGIQKVLKEYDREAE